MTGDGPDAVAETASRLRDDLCRLCQDDGEARYGDHAACRRPGDAHDCRPQAEVDALEAAARQGHRP